MIWALLFILLFGSSDSTLQALFDEASSRVSIVVEDKARMKEVNAVIKRAASLTSDYEKARKKDYDAWLKLSRKGAAAERADYEALFATITERDRAYQSEMIQLRGTLRDKVTREEWEQIFPNPTP
jgi:hypothetical protein